MVTHGEMILRITVGALLGGVIGVERDIHRRQAGFRTHLIVSMASATFMVVSAHFVHYQSYVAGMPVTVDPSRIAAAVVAGVGFLGGGSILRTGATVQGLTTAAGLWLVAAIGLCSGAGMYPEAGFVTLLGLVTLTMLRVLEDKNVTRRVLELTFNGPGDHVARVSKLLEGLAARVLKHDYRRNLREGWTSISFDVLIPNRVEIGDIANVLEGLEDLREIQLRVP